MKPVKQHSMSGFVLRAIGGVVLTCCALLTVAVVLGTRVPGRVMAYSTTFSIGVIDVERGVWVKVLTSSGIPLSCPVWSPDGDRLAVYQREPDGTNSIYVMRLSGGMEKYVPEFLSRATSIVSAFIWSPEGNAVAFFAIDNNTSAAGLWVYDLTRQELKIITRTDFSDNIGLAWSGDGQSLWYLSNAPTRFSIVRVRLDDLQPQSILTEPGNAFSFRLSHDEQSIVYDVMSRRQSDIYRVNVDGSNRQLLTSADSSDLYPLWSPGNDRVAFYSSGDGKSEIYLMNADGAALTRLTDNSAQEMQVAWSPDGQELAYVSYRNGLAQIYTMDAAGTTERQITHDPTNKYCPAWQP